MRHVHFIGVLFSGGTSVGSLLGPFTTYAEAEAAVQAELGEGEIGGVQAFNLVTAPVAPPEGEPAPADTLAAKEAQAAQADSKAPPAKAATGKGGSGKSTSGAD
jgi:hypothetical protein